MGLTIYCIGALLAFWLMSKYYKDIGDPRIIIIGMILSWVSVIGIIISKRD